MIIGIGTDLVGIERIARILEGQHGEMFLSRVLTKNELSMLNTRYKHPSRVNEFVAGRWAAKEAIAKALGCGIGAMVAFSDIEVLGNEQGQPSGRLSDAAQRRLGAQELRIHISISHAEGFAVAYALIERG
jgi:holo-[acyl-carrier protein] synthase